MFWDCVDLILDVLIYLKRSLLRVHPQEKFPILVCAFVVFLKKTLCIKYFLNETFNFESCMSLNE